MQVRAPEHHFLHHARHAPDDEHSPGDAMVLRFIRFDVDGPDRPESRALHVGLIMAEAG